MFVSMRRLQKPVWMLNYNGEAHGLRQDVNQRDWATLIAPNGAGLRVLFLSTQEGEWMLAPS